MNFFLQALIVRDSVSKTQRFEKQFDRGGQENICTNYPRKRPKKKVPRQGRGMTWYDVSRQGPPISVLSQLFHLVFEPLGVLVPGHQDLTNLHKQLAASGVLSHLLDGIM